MRARDFLQEEPVDALVFGQFRMERRRKQVPLSRHDDATVAGGQRLNVGTCRLDPRGPDEDAPERPRSKHRHAQVGLEAVDLASERVAPGDDVHKTEQRLAGELHRFACDEDEPRARPVDGHPPAVALSDGVDEAVGFDELADRRAFPAGDDQALDVLKLVGLLDGDALGAAAREHPLVFADIALEG